MKLPITIIILCLALAGKGQQYIPNTFSYMNRGKDTVYVGSKCYATLPPQYDDTYKVKQSDGSWKEIIIARQIDNPVLDMFKGFPIRHIQSDTLIISDTSIHFIKIGEQVFEIKRNVTLEPAKHNVIYRFPLSGGNYIFPADTTWNTRIYTGF